MRAQAYHERANLLNSAHLKNYVARKEPGGSNRAVLYRELVNNLRRRQRGYIKLAAAAAAEEEEEEQQQAAERSELAMQFAPPTGRKRKLKNRRMKLVMGMGSGNGRKKVRLRIMKKLPRMVRRGGPLMKLGRPLMKDLFFLLSKLCVGYKNVLLNLNSKLVPTRGAGGGLFVGSLCSPLAKAPVFPGDHIDPLLLMDFYKAMLCREELDLDVAPISNSRPHKSLTSIPPQQ